jgi:hypothetical protein
VTFIQKCIPRRRKRKNTDVINEGYSSHPDFADYDREINQEIKSSEGLDEYEESGATPGDYESKTADRPFPYLIKTYQADTLKTVDVVWLHDPDLTTYDDKVPFALGSNQELVPIGI